MDSVLADTLKANLKSAATEDAKLDTLNIRPSDIELIAGEIRTAQQELDNAAALAKADAPREDKTVA